METIPACPDLTPLTRETKTEVWKQSKQQTLLAMSTEVKLRVRLFVLLNATLGKMMWGAGGIFIEGEKEYQTKKTNLGVT